MKKLSLLAVICLALFAGCKGVQYSDQPIAQTIDTYSESRTITRVIAAADEWRNSGVTVEEGKTYILLAKGTWHVGGACGKTSANGVGTHNAFCWDIGNPLSTHEGGALIAKIGDDGNLFAVGEELELKAHETGVLYFSSNDPLGYRGDNSGHIDVTIKEARPRMAAPQSSLPVAELPQETVISPLTEAVSGRRTALVIGNSAYAVGPLKNPVNDATAIAQSLADTGFEVILLTNASLRSMEEGVDKFHARLKQGGAGLFYYAGHGLQVKGRNYLVPSDANLKTESDVKFKCLDAGIILGRMEDAGNELNIVILDACRNNPFARSFRSSERGLARMDAPMGSFIAYATSPGSVAADGSGSHGIYTKHLLANMKRPGLDLSYLFMTVRKGVVDETQRKQVPWESSSLTGLFYFVPPSDVTQ